MAYKHKLSAVAGLHLFEDSPLPYREVYQRMKLTRFTHTGTSNAALQNTRKESRFRGRYNVTRLVLFRALRLHPRRDCPEKSIMRKLRLH